MLRNLSPLLLASAGIALLFGALSSGSSKADDLVPRAYLPKVAADSAPGSLPPGPPTLTPTATRTGTPGAGATPAGLTLCTVTNVVDGDTIDVSGCSEPGRIRLLLIDTPEVNPGECFGKEATEYTKSRLLNRQVGIEKDISNKDGFGRNLRYIWIDGELFNEVIVRDGYAVLAIYPPDVKYLDRIEAAQTTAQSFSSGLWPACGGVGVPGTPTPIQSATATPTSSPTPFGTATPTPTASGACQAASATITGLDKVLEIVTVSGSGNLDGWYLISTRGDQRFDFPDNFTLSGSVQIRAATAPFPNSSGQLWWTSANQWNNSEDDDAVLYDCTGQQRSYFDDGE